MMVGGVQSLSPEHSGTLQVNAGYMGVSTAGYMDVTSSACMGVMSTGSMDITPSQGCAPMSSSPGMKRKFDVAWQAPDERQSILDISLCKLRTPKTVPHRTNRRSHSSEPSLRRSVLIFNTLRHIEMQLRREGVPVPPAATWSPPAEAEDTLDTPPQVDPCRTSPEWFPAPVCPMTNSGLVRDCSSPTMPMDTSCSNTDTLCSPSTGSTLQLPCVSPAVDCDTTRMAVTASDALLNSDKLTLCSFRSLLDLDRPVSLPTPPPCQRAAPPAQPPRPPSPPTFTTLTTLSSSSLLATANNNNSQEPFSDLDLSAYDFDLLSSFCPSLKVSPISAEELMHTVPVEPLNVNGRSTCSFRSEDIDHIMQVLVNI